MPIHETFIEQTFTLAKKAQGKTGTNPLVGCVIVKNNKIISLGYHKGFGRDHAEIDALKKIQFSANGCKLYVNLEPCFHTGKTPPCVDAVIKSGVAEVIIAMRDPNPLTNGKSVRKLRSHGIKVTENVCKNQAKELNYRFLLNINEKRPYVVAKSAQTLDGKIATSTNDSKWITSAKTRTFARNIRNEFDAIAVGINTLLTDNPQLSSNKSPTALKKIIFDSRLRTKLNCNVIKNTSPDLIYLVISKTVTQTKISQFRKKGINIIQVGLKRGKINLNEAFNKLYNAGIGSVLIEGGGQLIGGALKAGVVDQLHLYIAPKILGDQDAISSVSGINPRKITDCINLKTLTQQHIGDDLFIKADVYRNR